MEAQEQKEEQEWDGKVEEKTKEQVPADGESKDKINKIATLLKAIMALKMTKDDKQPSEVIPNLFIGSIGTAMSKDILKNLGITHVLVCAANLNPPFESDFNYLTIPVLDKPKANVMVHFSKTNEYIKNALDDGGKVLVH